MEADLSRSTSTSSERPHFTRLTRSQANNAKNSAVGTELSDLNVFTSGNKIDQVEKIYLNKKPKVMHKNLETIYEHPIQKKGSTLLVGKTKVKRSINFNHEFRIISKQKSKLRKIKAKRLGEKIKLRKLSDDEFKSKMLKIESYINGSDVEPNKTECNFVDFGKAESAKISTNNFAQNVIDCNIKLSVSSEGSSDNNGSIKSTSNCLLTEL